MIDQLTASPEQDSRPPSSILLEAIALKQCVRATYNRMDCVLAPHILYTRHDELYVDAVTVSRDGKPPKEVKLGTFKIAGLHDLLLQGLAFRPQADFDVADRKYAAVTLFAVSRD